jgi:hypothetical protein
MTSRLESIAILLAIVTFGARADVRHGTDAAGCVASTLLCNSTQTGELTAGDCTFSDGTRYDVWQFAGSAGQFVTVRLHVVSLSFTSPLLWIFPPSTDASETPQVGFGTSDLAVRYKLSSTGTWSIVVNTYDLIAGGQYQISLSCTSDPYPSYPQNCVPQPLSCGQGASWALTATSCRAGGTSNGVYADYELGRFQRGDTITLSAHSRAFDVGLGVYDGDSADPLAFNWGQAFPNVDAHLTYVIPRDGNYFASIFGPDSKAAGDFAITEVCALTCTAPAFTIVPQPITLDYNSQVTMFVRLTGTGPFTYRWYDTADPFATLYAGSDYTVAHVTKTTRYAVDVSSACGALHTEVTISVRPPRHRSVHH